MTANAFTCTGPYAILVMLGVKRVENRSVMPVPDRGRCAVSCSKSFGAEEYGNFVRWASASLPSECFERIPAWADVKDWPGKVVGCCDYAARTAREPFSGRPREAWDEGYPYWWDLSEVVCFDRPIPCRGNVGMWKMPPDLAARVSAADSLAASIGEKIAAAADAVRVFLLALPVAGRVEGVFVLPLDADRRTLSEPVLVSLGDPTTAAVEPGEVFAVAFRHDAKAIIIAHNHPSGNPTPSLADVELTKSLMEASGLVGVALLDHLVIGSPGSAGGCGYASVMQAIKLKQAVEPAFD